MSDIIIRNINEQSFILEGCSNLSTRKKMKFNIFMNSLSNVSVIKSFDTFVISSNDDEQHELPIAIKGIVCQLENLMCDVQLDEVVSKLLKAQEIYQENLESTIDSLRLIKTNSVYLNEDFKEFCKFCDSVLKISLRDYQYKAAYLLTVGRGGFDFSVPGAGKTIISYTAYVYLKHIGLLDQVFVIGPSSSYNAWFDEYVTCFSEIPDFENLGEETTANCRLYLNSSSKNHKEICFINMEKVRLITTDIIEYISKNRTLLIVDEAHKIKSPNAAVTNAVLRIAKYANARILLTGTPMPNGYEDLYSLTKAFSPFDEILPYNYNQLRLMTKNNSTKAQNETIRKCLNPYYSRISKKYLLLTNELLPPKFHFLLCDMDENQSLLYNKLNEFCGKLSEDVDEDILISLKKAIMIRKMQISANPALLQKSLISSMDELRVEYSNTIEKCDSKIDQLVKVDRNLMDEFSKSTIFKTVSQYSSGALSPSKNKRALELALKIVESGEKVLIWDIFVDNMTKLKKILEENIDTKVELINGSVIGYERQMAIKRFREHDSMILLANPATLAESISLHKVCQNAIYVNRNFNAAQYIQSKDRIHRINMPIGKTAKYYILLNNESVDLGVDERLRFKEERMLEILDADDIIVGGSEMEDNNIMSFEDIEENYRR